ncbi:MAG: ABC transporter permease [Trebonia sp.]
MSIHEGVSGGPSAAQDSADEPAPPARRGWWDTVRWGADKLEFTRLSGLYILALFILIFALWIPDTFLRVSTLKNILTAQSITGVLSVGLVCAMAAGAFDLAFAQAAGTGSILAAILTTSFHMNVVLTVVIVIAYGALVGLVNSLLVTKVGLSSIVATLGTSSVMLAIDEKLTNQNYISGVPRSFITALNGTVLGIPEVVLIMVAVVLIGWYVLVHTPPGRRMYATGHAPEAARLAGVRTSRSITYGFLGSGLASGVAGLMLLAVVGTGDPTAGPSYLLPVFAALFLGTTQVHPGRFNVWGTVIGIFLLGVGVQGLQLAGYGDQWISDLFNGVALLLATGFAVRNRALRRR